MVEVARRVLREQGFALETPRLERSIPAHDPVDGAVDLRELPWTSIDNAESRDLDQVEHAVREGEAIRLQIGIADVDALVPAGSPIDEHAHANTTSLYTGVAVFPMLPEALSEDRTSLLEDRDRLAVVTEFVVRADGSLDDQQTRIYRAQIRNHAKLVYERVGAWLEGQRSAAPADREIAAQLELHDEAATRMRRRRFELGALDFDTIEARPVAQGGRVVDLVVTRKNRARELVEDLMIGANGATARFLEMHEFSSLRRVVRAPKRWDRIVELAADYGHTLPAEPSAPALAKFLEVRRAAAPQRFADLSLSIVKLLGPGEYVLQRAREDDTGHFGLAVEDYGHSTAPNRRYPDLVTQRLLKACAAGERPPYSDDQLLAIAAHCTERENAARKVERTMRKIAAAVLLSSRIGDEFDGIVTGASNKGTYVRLFRPPAEGRVVTGERGLDVGDQVRVRLVDTEPMKGFIDFASLGKG